MSLNPFYIKVVNIQLSVSLNKDVTKADLNSLVVNKNEITEKIDSVFHLLREERPNFIVFPEYSFFEELRQTFIDYSRIQNVVIISGSYINADLIPELNVFLPDGNTHIVQKNGIAPPEYTFFNNITLQGGPPPNQIFTTGGERPIKFLPLICYDFYAHYAKFFELDLDLLLVSAFNKDNHRFYSTFNEFCDKNPSFCVYSNVTGTSHGYSAVFGIHETIDVHEKHLRNGMIYIDPLNADLVSNKPNLISNIEPTLNQMIITELDINRPYIIRPRAIAGNNAPNVLNTRKVNI